LAAVPYLVGQPAAKALLVDEDVFFGARVPQDRIDLIDYARANGVLIKVRKHLNRDAIEKSKRVLEVLEQVMKEK